MAIERIQKKQQKIQRREFFRVFYPRKVRPEITTLNAKVIDISIKAMRFEIYNVHNCKIEILPDRKLELKLKFRDGQTIEVAGMILPRLDNRKGNIYICIFDEAIPSEIIAKESAYLLKHFKKFCIVKYHESLRYIMCNET